jgi:hypothetical protein
MIARGPCFHGGGQANGTKPHIAAKSLTGKSPASGTQGTENLSALGWGDMPHQYDKLSHTKTQSPINDHLLFNNLQRRSMPDNISKWRRVTKGMGDYGASGNQHDLVEIQAKEYEHNGNDDGSSKTASKVESNCSEGVAE